MSSPQPPTPPKTGGSRLLPVGFVLLLVVAAGGYYLYERSKNKPEPPPDEFQALKPFFTQLGKSQTLAEGYADTNKDLVADAPTDPAKFLKVEEIGFTTVGTDDEERLKREQAEWADFMKALEAATGKKVKYLTDVPSPEGQMEALRAGRLHVTAFNTGAVPAAVNTAGFVPLFAPADAQGNFTIQMQILVKADSPIQKPEDLRGKTVGFVSLSSNSGAKAPMVILKDKYGMLPGRDYQYKLSGDHFVSLAGVVYGTDYDAVCVASDLKDRAVAAGKIKFGPQEKDLKAEQFRVILSSDPFPPLCFGVPHNLPPEVRAGVEKAFRDYKFTGASARRAKFVPVNYEKDWKYVREIDAALGRFAEIP
ncbi:MAG TPA: phosphate/phosphite/phosphonate ABC transporter substrate-binding protein [Gemmataceae bacterium]|nr:phosphate/phosphite/phosphonate ABC transporter substrate-binding protein [Gemmataceae bacterium]